MTEAVGSGSTPYQPPDPVAVFVNRCLAEFDGFLVQGEALCGHIENTQLAFQVEREVRDIPTERIALISALDSGQLEVWLRTGERVQGIWETKTIRVHLPTAAEEVVTISTDKVSLLVFQGQLGHLDIQHRLAMFKQISRTFQEIRQQADLIVLENGSVLTGQIMTVKFALRLDNKSRSFLKGIIDRIFRRPNGQISIVIRGNSKPVTGTLETASVEVDLSVAGQLIDLPFEEVNQLVMANPKIVYGGGAIGVKLVP